MFGKKKIPQSAPAETSVEKPAAIEPYKDEPAVWAEMPSEQLLEVWYHLADASGTEPQPDGADPTLWYLEAAHTGDPAAQYALGKYYYREGNIFQTGLWYSKASALGSPFADYELAKFSEYGIGMEADKEEAHDRYEKAYAAFAAKVDEKPNKAIAMKLAAMCDHHLVDAPEDDSRKWRELLKSRRKETLKAPEQVPQAQTEEPVREEEEQPDQISPAPIAAEPVIYDLPGAAKEVSVSGKSTVMQPRGIPEDVPVEYILPAEDNPYAANDTDADLYALAMSIEVNGLINPLVLNQISERDYRIISGERRWKAITRYLHWDTIPATVHYNLSANAAQIMLHTANLEVRDYTPGQKLQFYIQTENLVRQMQQSGEYSGGIQKGIAETLGISTHQVRKYKRIIENLPQEKLNQVVNGEISIERAYKLSLVPPVVTESASDDEPDAVEKPTGHTSTSTEEPDAVEEPTGRTSAPAEEPDAVEEPTGRTSAPAEEPDAVEEATGRTSGFQEPENYADALALLQELPVEPGQLCAVISDDKVDGGMIDRIELYENTVLVSVMVDSLRHPFPISLLDKVLFVGTGCFDRAETAVRNN